MCWHILLRSQRAAHSKTTVLQTNRTNEQHTGKKKTQESNFKQQLRSGACIGKDVWHVHFTIGFPHWLFIYLFIFQVWVVKSKSLQNTDLLLSAEFIFKMTHNYRLIHKWNWIIFLIIPQVGLSQLKCSTSHLMYWSHLPYVPRIILSRGLNQLFKSTFEPSSESLIQAFTLCISFFDVLITHFATDKVLVWTKGREWYSLPVQLRTQMK